MYVDDVRIDIGPAVIRFQPALVSINRTRQMPIDALEVEIENNEHVRGWVDDELTGRQIRVWQWYGDAANAVRTFTGLVDELPVERDPDRIALKCRDRLALAMETVGLTAPQGPDEAGAVRDPSNYVYLGMEVAAIVADLADRIGWPAGERRIFPTSYVVAEFRANDGESHLAVIQRLGVLVGYEVKTDELGHLIFGPVGATSATETGVPAAPVWTFRTGEDITSLKRRSSLIDVRTRVRARGPFTSLKDAWTEQWHTNVIRHPSGVAFQPADPDNVQVIDGLTRMLYWIRQSDQVVVADSSPVTLGFGGFLNGLSADPADPASYWVLETPWVTGGDLGASWVHQVNRSDNSIANSYGPLPSKRYTSLKVSADWIWLAQIDDDVIERWDRGLTLQDSQAIVYEGVPQLTPTGIAIDDGQDKIYLGFQGQARMLQMRLSDLVAGTQTFERVLVFAGTQSLGGDVDTLTHSELYAESYELGLLYKYTLAQPATADVSVEVIDGDLEDELGGLAGVGDRFHDAHPLLAPHPFCVRRETMDLAVVTSMAQSTETARRRLAIVNGREVVYDAGIIGNPAVGKGDMVRVEDPLTGVAIDLVVDTIRTSQDPRGGWLGTIALLPWDPSY